MGRLGQVRTLLQIAGTFPYSAAVLEGSTCTSSTSQVHSECHFFFTSHLEFQPVETAYQTPSWPTPEQSKAVGNPLYGPFQGPRYTMVVKCTRELLVLPLTNSLRGEASLRHKHFKRSPLPHERSVTKD